MGLVRENGGKLKQVMERNGGNKRVMLYLCGNGCEYTCGVRGTLGSLSH